MNKINDLTYTLNGAAIEVHRELGPGLLESAYEAAFCYELTLRKIPYFNVTVLKDGIRRLANNLEDSSALSAPSAVKKRAILV
jgi:hypothetical protein